MPTQSMILCVGMCKEPYKNHTGIIQNRIIFGSACWVELYRTVYELYITIGVVSVWNCTELYGSL